MKNKILVITPRFPYPVIGGDRLRIYEVCKELSKKYSITLASLCETRIEMNMPLPEDGVFDTVHRVFLPKYASVFNCILGLASESPLQVCYYRSKKFQTLLNTISSEHDLIIPHLVRVAEYVKDINLPKIIEMTDAISMNYERVISTKNSAGLLGAIYKIEFERLNRYEKEIAKYFDNTVFVSKYDKDYLYKSCDTLYNRAIVASNGVDLEKFPYDFEPNSQEIIFIGNLHSAQNYDAAYWFAENVMPKLSKYGGYTFKIIGRIPESRLKKLQSFNGVFCTGAVDSVIESAKGAIAGVCSVRLAAGVQNKILEYMALGIPTITSTIGLEGLGAIPDKDLIVADTVDEYVNAILKLESNRDFAESLALSGREYVIDSHSWESKLSPIVNQIDKLIGS